MTDLTKVIEQLELRKTELESRIKHINADVSHQNQPLSGDWSEQAVERENDEVLEALGNSSQQELYQIKRALQRIEQGIYQICDDCDEEIPLKRLELIPHATRCIRCEEKMESKG